MRPPRPSADPAPDVPAVVAAGVFKAKVTVYLRHVERTGSTIIITNRGRPVATLTSAVRRPGNTFVGAGRGAIRIPQGETTDTPLTTLPSWSATTATTVTATAAVATLERSGDALVPRLLSGRSVHQATSSTVKSSDHNDQHADR